MDKQRDFYFDNFKAFLIVLVVIGHFLGPVANQYETVSYIRKLIFLFHMPAFIFISGYFSRHNDWVKVVKKVFIPYIILQVIFCIFYNFVWGAPRFFSILTPGYTLWFLLCLFIWRLTIDKLAKIRGILPLLFLFGILAGFNSEIGKTISLSRMITFFPYFLLGYQFDKEKFMKWANRKSSYCISGIVLIGISVWMAFYHSEIRFRLLESSYSYSAMHLKNGFIQRGILYLISTTMIFALAVWIPKTKRLYSYLGGRTMGIYMIHGMIIKTVVSCTNWYDYFNTPVKISLLMVIAFLICLLLSTNIVHRFVSVLSKVPFERLIKKDTDCYTKG